MNDDGSGDEDDLWAGEDTVKSDGIPSELWSDAPIDKAPEMPEKWIDDLADKVEVQRLCAMRVLLSAAEFQQEPTGKLTTKLVRDWRLKSFGEGTEQKKRWMRRSQGICHDKEDRHLQPSSRSTCVKHSALQVFGNERCSFCVGSGSFCHDWASHCSVLFWFFEMKSKADYDVVLGTLDVSDAFLQVDQDQPVLVKLQGKSRVICKNLPGQRLGAKQWFQHLRAHLESSMGFEFSMEQTCMARTPQCTILIHVDDVMYVGSRAFWNEVFLPNMSKKFSISHDELKGNGTSDRPLPVCGQRKA